MKLALRWVLALVALVAASAAWATFHTYQIDEIFSNADGTVQFIVLREAAGMNGQNFLAGRTLTSTGGSANQTFTFPTNLGISMDTGYGQMLTPTAFTRVLIATQGFAQLGIVAPDYLIPNGFIPTGNGTINYAGVDQVTYTTLPVDGALLRAPSPAGESTSRIRAMSSSRPGSRMTLPARAGGWS